jgi:hypothetical protein
MRELTAQEEYTSNSYRHLASTMAIYVPSWTGVFSHLAKIAYERKNYNFYCSVKGLGRALEMPDNIVKSALNGLKCFKLIEIEKQGRESTNLLITLCEYKNYLPENHPL